MNVRQLIEELEEMAEIAGDEAEVLLAIQPSWPLALKVANVSAGEDRVWVAASDSHPADRSPYAPAAAWSGEWPEDEIG